MAVATYISGPKHLYAAMYSLAEFLSEMYD